MFTEPNTDIYLLNAIPLEDNYVNTILFANSTAQYNYFYQRRSKSLTEYSYQRVNKNTIRVGVNYHDLLVCNYMMFRNKSHENKWYYAFIKEYNYINEVTSEIVYEIDVMQTYQFDFEPNMCLVEREHTVTDNLYEHTVEENLDVGKEMVQNTRREVGFNDKVYVVLSAYAHTGWRPRGGVYSNVYTPLNVTFHPTAEACQSYVEAFYIDNGREDQIQNIYTMPKIAPFPEHEGKPLPFTEDYPTSTTEATTFYMDTETAIDGYTPVNKKLFTSEFNRILVSGFAGSVAEFKPELWDITHIGEFEIHGSFFPNPDVKIYPKHYRGFAKDYENNVTLSDYPLCPWVGDTYKVWMAQNGGQVATSLVSSAVSSLVAMDTVGGLPLAISAANTLMNGPVDLSRTEISNGRTGANALINTPTTVANTLAKIHDIKNIPPSVHGSMKAPGYIASQDMYKFVLSRMTIRKEYALIVDKYFTKYGYKVNSLKKPTFNNRPHWTFVKTVDCTINGTLPANAESQICSILNRGITFWNDGSEVGNYSLDNSPTIS